MSSKYRRANTNRCQAVGTVEAKMQSFLKWIVQEGRVILQPCEMCETPIVVYPDSVLDGIYFVCAECHAKLE